MDLEGFKNNLQKCVDFLVDDLSKIHTGRANPDLVESVKVEAYGTDNPLKNIASISVADSRSLVIQPWDKSLAEAIVKGIGASNLGFLAMIEGDVVRIKIPELTQERRLEYVKVMKDKVEQARISVRNVRHEVMKSIDTQVEQGLPKDEGDRLKEEVEKSVKSSNEKIEEVKKSKEEELMAV